jgi:hypothetical protein
MRKNNSILTQDKKFTDYVHLWGRSDTTAIGPWRVLGDVCNFVMVTFLKNIK